MILAPLELEETMQYPLPAQHSVDLYEGILEDAFRRRISWLWVKALTCIRAVVLFKRLVGMPPFQHNRFVCYHIDEGKTRRFRAVSIGVLAAVRGVAPKGDSSDSTGVAHGNSSKIVPEHADQADHDLGAQNLDR